MFEKLRLIVLRDQKIWFCGYRVTTRCWQWGWRYWAFTVVHKILIWKHIRHLIISSYIESSYWTFIWMIYPNFRRTFVLKVLIQYMSDALFKSSVILILSQLMPWNVMKRPSKCVTYFLMTLHLQLAVWHKIIWMCEILLYLTFIQTNSFPFFFYCIASPGRCGFRPWGGA